MRDDALRAGPDTPEGNTCVDSTFYDRGHSFQGQEDSHSIKKGGEMYQTTVIPNLNLLVRLLSASVA